MLITRIIVFLIGTAVDVMMNLKTESFLRFTGKIACGPALIKPEF